MLWRTVGALASVAAVLLGACTKDPGAPTSSSIGASGAPSAAPAKADIDPLALPDGVLDAQNLKHYGYAAMDFVRKDEFSSEFNEAPLVGRRFKVTIPFEKYDSSLSYTYNVEKEAFTVSVYPTSNDHEKSYTTRFDYLILDKNSVFGAPTPMSNAFGATKDVTPVSYRVIGIGSRGNAYMGVAGKMKYSTPDFTLYTQLSKTVKLSPDAARAAAAGLAMDVEGVVVKPKDAKAITCTDAKTTATMIYAYQETWRECVISVKLSRITVHSPATGVIADWPEADKRH